MTDLVDLLAYDPDKVKPGWIAFFIVMILVVATFLLWRSMNTQLGRIRVPPRSSFESSGPDGGKPAEPPSGTAPVERPDRADEDPPPPT